MVLNNNGKFKFIKQMNFNNIGTDANVLNNDKQIKLFIVPLAFAFTTTNGWPRPNYWCSNRWCSCGYGGGGRIDKCYNSNSGIDRCGSYPAGAIAPTC